MVSEMVASTGLQLREQPAVRRHAPVLRAAAVAGDRSLWSATAPTTPAALLESLGRAAGGRGGALLRRGSAKPSPEIYVSALDDLGVAAADAVMIDGQVKYLVGAERSASARSGSSATARRSTASTDSTGPPRRLGLPHSPLPPRREVAALTAGDRRRRLPPGGPVPRAAPGARPLWQAGIMTAGTTPHVVIIGGGIAGLAAAFFLRDEPVRVTVLEGSPRLGGKLSASDVAGVSMDEGAEALLTRRPEGIGLMEDGRPGRRPGPGRRHLVRDLHPGRAPLAAPQAVHGRPADLDELAASKVVSGRGDRPGSGRVDPAVRGSGRRRSPRTSAPGSGSRSWTGWSTRCSAASTPAAPRTCRSRPRWPR